jgi:hypothetical protein
MDSAFEVHMLNDAGKQKAKQIAEMFDGLLESAKNVATTGLDLASPLPPDIARELSLVRTHLEIACFFCKKAMANNLVNQ